MADLCVANPERQTLRRLSFDFHNGIVLGIDPDFSTIQELAGRLRINPEDKEITAVFDPGLEQSKVLVCRRERILRLFASGFLLAFQEPLHHVVDQLL